MDELMLMEYLRDKGIGKNMSEQEFMNKFKEFMSKGSRSHYMRHHGDGVEQKIIESAVIFWFKDDDYKDGFKLWNYFKED